jgi:hypothetical protein
VFCLNLSAEKILITKKVKQDFAQQNAQSEKQGNGLLV